MTRDEYKAEITALARRIPELIGRAADHSREILAMLVELLTDERVLDELTAQDLDKICIELGKLCNGLDSVTTVARGVVALMQEMGNDR